MLLSDIFDQTGFSIKFQTIFNDKSPRTLKKTRMSILHTYVHSYVISFNYICVSISFVIVIN